MSKKFSVEIVSDPSPRCCWCGGAPDAVVVIKSLSSKIVYEFSVCIPCSKCGQVIRRLTRRAKSLDRQMADFREAIQ